MAPAKAGQRGAYLLYNLFHQYASQDQADNMYGIASISYTSMKQLMLDMDLLEGVPPALVDVFVREQLQRADQGGSGFVGAQDFLVWLLTEVAALLPLRDAFCGVTGLRPLYNQFHAVLLGDLGFTDGARRPARGLTAAHLQRLAGEYGLVGSAEGEAERVRQAFKAARAAIGGFRGSSGANTGAQMAEPAGGGRLQFAAFVWALAGLAAQKMDGLDAVLYRVVSCGAPPNPADPRVIRPPVPRGEMSLLGLQSQLEGACIKESYNCENCGQKHQRWRLDNWLPLEELLLSLGVPHPVRRFLPSLQLVNGRNLRAAFHRYNAKYNKGRLPPASYKLPGGSSAKGGGGGDEPGEGQGPFASAATVAAAASAGSDAGGGGCCSQPAAYGACCCLFRSLSVMEMSSWLRLCGHCDAIRELSATHGSGVTPATLESAFVQASAIAGVYCADIGAGIHDVPVGSVDGGARLGLPRNSLGAVVGSAARAAPDHMPPKRSTAAYHAPPGGQAMTAAAPPSAAASGRGGGGGGSITPRLYEVQGPSSAAAWLASARSRPYDSSGGGGSSASSAWSQQQQHRPSRLVLTFPQFLEALRLVAEEAGGHPTRTTAAEHALLRIVHDVVRDGCPRPDPTTATGTAQIRRQQQARRAGGGGDFDGRGGGEGVKAVSRDLQQQQQQQQAVEAAASAAPQAFSGTSFSTSTSTSTKYSYDDFTPPDSDLYSSSRSSCSRLPGSRTGGPAAANSARNSGDGARPGNGADRVPGPKSSFGASSASSTSTKYSYDDFTPPDSSRYTSAGASSSNSNSRSGPRSGADAGGRAPDLLSSRVRRPQPVRALSNPHAAGGSGKPLPSQLQAKQRGGASAASAAEQLPSPAAGTGWIVTMPLPPSPRLRTSAAPSSSVAVEAVRGGNGGGSNGPGVRPASAPRDLRQTPAAGLMMERVEYVAYGDAVDGVGGGSSGGPSRALHQRPASARQLGGGSATSGAFAVINHPNPPFDPRGRQASAAVQRSRPAAGGNDSCNSARPPPPVSYPAAAAAVTARHAAEPPGVTGRVQVRSTSAHCTRPSSASAAAAGRSGAADGPRRAGARGAARVAEDVADALGGVVRPFPFSGVANAAPVPPTYGAARASPSGPSTRGAAQQRRPAGSARTSLGAAGRTSTGSSSSRVSPGVGFVAPWLPEPYAPTDGDAAAAPPATSPAKRPHSRSDGAAALPVAAAAEADAEAVAAAALAAAPTYRRVSAQYGGIPKMPPQAPLPPSRPHPSSAMVALERTTAAPLPDPPAAVGNVNDGRSSNNVCARRGEGAGSDFAAAGDGGSGIQGSGGGGADKPSSGRAAADPGSLGGPGLRNHHLLSLPIGRSNTGLGSEVGSSPERAGRRGLPAATSWGASMRRINSGSGTMEGRRQSAAVSSGASGPAPQPPAPQAAGALPMGPVSLPAEAVGTLSVGVATRTALMGSGEGGARRGPRRGLSPGEVGADGDEAGAGLQARRPLDVAVPAAPHPDNDDASTAGGVNSDDPGSSAADSPRAVLAASFQAAVNTTSGRGRTRVPAEGTVNGLPQYFFA